MAPQLKRRKLENAVEEISFDPDARHEYLTGFHKRKVQRIKLAQEHAEKRAREEREREERRKIREQRAAEIEQALNESKRMLEQIRGDVSSQESGSDSDSEEWQGFEEPAPVDYKEEYIDEDKYTTVTVEEMGLSKDELHQQDKSSDDEEKDKTKKEEEAPKKSKAPKKYGSKSGAPKKKKKQFRYESKEERKITRRKERTGSKKKASARKER